MMLTNHKLFLRAVGIVADVGGAAPARARRALLRAAYGLDDARALDALDAAEAADARAVERHIARASEAEMVIPTALVLVLLGEGGEGGGAGGAGDAGAVTVGEARVRLRRQPNVRRAVGELVAERERERARTRAAE